jgi:hypothetical protein
MTVVDTRPIINAMADREPDRLFGHPLPRCPRCGARELDTVVEDQSQEVHFYCRTCERCWRVELGFAQPIARSACRCKESPTQART